MGRQGSADLKRRAATREPKRLFILFCEGENTEPAYFNAIRKRFDSVKIEIVAPAGVPMTIANEAVNKLKQIGLSRRKRKELNSFEESDQVWAVFDCDHHPNYREAVLLCEKAGVNVARSNPCFELWLILHIEEYDKPDGHHAVQRRFRP